MSDYSTEDMNDFVVTLISLFGYDFGIKYISSLLKDKGYKTYIIQFGQLRYPAEFLDNDYFTPSLPKHNPCSPEDVRLLIDLLKQLKPKVVGISLTSVTFKTAKIITARIKKHLDVIVVWGGIHATISPEECILHADIVCRGEGELPMWELVEKLRKRERVASIQNLWIRDNARIERNELRPLIENLDDLPFADFIDRTNKFLIDSGKIVTSPPIISGYEIYSYPIMSSRGCMFGCSFCCNSIIKEEYRGKGSYLRRRNVRNVIEELKRAIKELPIGLIRFWDDVFTYDKEWIKDFSEHYLAEVGKPLGCYAHPTYTDKDIIAALAKAGLVSIIVGIQSGSEMINRNLFARSQSHQDILEFTKTVKRLYINPRYDVIVDNPYETEQDHHSCVELLAALPRPYFMQFYSLCYFPKTPLTQKALCDTIITANDVEQHSSKAFNNFFLSLSLSKTKKRLFWNCIKAMAVNHHFPKRLVWFCKMNRLFRKYPQVLFFLSRYYLYLFKQIGKKKLRVWTTPALVEDVLINNYLISGKAGCLFRKRRIFYTLFPVPGAHSFKKFCLTITNTCNKSLSMYFLIEIIPLNETRLSNKSVWSIKREVDKDTKHDIYLDLAYPELFFSFGEKRIRAKLLKKGNFEAGGRRLYVLKLKVCFLKKLIPWRLPYRTVSRILCTV